MSLAPDLVTQRWTKSAADKRAVERGCYFDERKANHIVRFFEQHLRHAKDWSTGKAGSPFRLMDWQKEEVLRPLFGWMRPDKTRRYRSAFIEVPKKNGKSPLCSGIALYLLGADKEFGSRVICAACDRKQAGIVFDDALKMAKMSPLLQKYITPKESTKELEIPSSNSKLEAISHEAFRNEGLNSHGVMFDELHAQKSRFFWDALRYAGAARRQPMQVAITTAGFDRESICYEQHERAQKMLEGTIEDDSFFAYIRAAGKDDDWTDPLVWEKANPSMGITVALDELRQACLEAQQSPAAENSFRRYRLNQWTEQATRRISMDAWDACGGHFEPADLAGRPCYAGLDLGYSDDISALVLVFPVDQRRIVVPFFWVPGESAEEREREHFVPYATWARQGFITLTKKKTTDFEAIRQKIIELGQLYRIEEIAFDAAYAGQLAQQLSDIDGFNMVKFPQTMMNFAGPTKEFLALILDGRLEHGGNPVLRWMAGNVETKPDEAGNERPLKRTDRQKVDGIVAAIMGLGRCMLACEVGQSVLSVIDLRD